MLDVAASSEVIQGVLRGQGARRASLNDLAELDGVTRWDIVLNLLSGVTSDPGGLGGLIVHKAGLIWCK